MIDNRRRLVISDRVVVRDDIGEMETRFLTQRRGRGSELGRKIETKNKKKKKKIFCFITEKK